MTIFELSSRGGYAREVTGTVAYLDEEAETYMVLGSDRGLIRVPLREITSTRDAHPDDDQGWTGVDTEGLGA